LKIIPYVLPILVRPLAVSVTVWFTHAGLGAAVTVGMVGQIEQPPGPFSVTVIEAVQLVAVFVTVTIYVPTVIPGISSVVALLLQI
jgi:hypothetical protein